MKLNATDFYLHTMLDAVRNVLLSEALSSPAHAVVVTMEECLLELTRRNSDSVANLKRSIAEGAHICQEISSALARRQIAGPALESSDSLEGAETSFDRCATRYNALSARLCKMAVALSEAPPQSDLDREVPSLLRAAAEWEDRSHRALLQGTARSKAGTSPDMSIEALQTFISHVHKDGNRARVLDLKPVPGGFGKQTFVIVVEDAMAERREYIVRKMNRAALLAHKGFRIENEFDLVRAVQKTGFPVPTPIWLAINPPGIDANFAVMEKLEGQIPGTLLGGAGNLSRSYLLEVAELLARLHRIDLTHLAEYIGKHENEHFYSETISSCYRREVAEWKRYALGSDAGHSAALVYLLDWLSRKVPVSEEKPVLVHGDFNIHNILAKDDHVTGVLDWESAMFGAPEQDLAYVRPHVSKHIPWEEFLAHYCRASGRSINSGALNYYQAFSMMRPLVAISCGMDKLKSEGAADIRHSMFELGLYPQFIRMALASIDF